MRATVHRLPLTDPADVSPLLDLIAIGAVEPAHIVAVIGKTPGNGLLDDHSRGQVTLALSVLLAPHLGLSPTEVPERIAFIFSGGAEGVLSPHYVVFCVDPAAPAGDPGDPSLAVAVAFTEPFEPTAIGRMPQVLATAEAVQAAMRSAHIERPEDVHFVQVKGPCLTTSMIAAAPPGSLAGDSPEKSIACSRIASALGVALALGEIAEDDFDGDKLLGDVKLWSSVAGTTWGVEVRRNEIVVLGRSARWSGDFTIAHRVMRDALDIVAVHEVLDDLGIASHPQVPPDQVTRIAGVFVRCEPARSGNIRGRAHTMLTDGDIDAQRQIRGAVGAIVAAVCGETAIFVSEGAENQGPDGGALLAIVARKPAATA